MGDSLRTRAGMDPVTLSLYRGLFAACAEEMGVTLMRTAHSPNIKERLDYSCALFDGRVEQARRRQELPELVLEVGVRVAGDLHGWRR